MADAGVPKKDDVIHKTDMDGFVTALNASSGTWKDKDGNDQSKIEWSTQTFDGNQSAQFTTIGSLHEPATPGTNGGDTALVQRKAVVDALAKKIEGLVGIDTNKLLYAPEKYLDSTTGYTATQDCWVTGRCYPDTVTANKFTLKIESADMGYINAYLGEYAIAAFGPIPLKKGQRLTFFVEGRVEYTYRVFGVLI